jgi:hypothetical protein
VALGHLDAATCTEATVAAEVEALLRNMVVDVVSCTPVVVEVEEVEADSR